MPPKKSRAAVTKGQVKNVLSASTQTDNDDDSHYKKQIEILNLKLQKYKEKITILESEISILRNVNSYDKTHLNEKQFLKIKSETVSSPKSGSKTIKGCSCKGNCSNKICGCVKKGIPCQEFCKCNDAQCKNQEPEKENINIQENMLTHEGQRALEKLQLLTLNQEFLHSSGKKSKRGIFSPSGDRSETRRKLFTQESDELLDIVVSDQESLSSVEPSNNIENVNNCTISQTLSTPLAKRTRRFKNSTKNNTISTTCDVPLIMVTNEAKLKIDNVTFSPLQIEKKSKPLSPNNYVVKRKYGNQISDKPKSTSISPDEHIKMNSNNKSQYGKVQHSPQTLKNHIKIEEKHNSNSHNQDENSYLIKSQVDNLNKKSFSSESNTSGRSSNNNFDDFDLSLNPMVPKRQLQRSPIQTAGTIRKLEETKQFSPPKLDISLNPMVPKRQLQRSPITATGTVMTLEESKRFSPPRKELAVPEVDWERHQSELIKCDICCRKFFPYRIEKHMLSCKGI